MVWYVLGSIIVNFTIQAGQEGDKKANDVAGDFRTAVEDASFVPSSPEGVTLQVDPTSVSIAQNPS